MKNNENIQHKLLDYGLKAVIVVGAVYGITKVVKHYQKSNTEHQVEKNPAVNQAMAIYSAMNPSGMDWMKKMDGTNTESILNTAKEITDLNNVQDAYRKLYNSSLLDDLRQELSPEDYTKFMNTLKYNPNSGNKGTSNASANFKRGSFVATKLQANIRKTPKNISKWSLDSNIIKLAEAGKFIGFATGYWAVFMSMASESFGTNIRATVTTTAPNFVRGAVIPLTFTYQLLKGSFNIQAMQAAIIIGVITFVLALIAAYNLEETFHKDLDYIEE